MAVSIQQVSGALTRAGVKFHQVDDSRILFTFTCDNCKLNLILTLTEKGGYLDLRTFELAKLGKDHGNLEGVLQFLAQTNLRYKLVKYIWDPGDADGEVIANACLPLEDNGELSHQQLLGFILLLVNNCDKVYPDLQKALQTRGGGRPAPAPAVRPAPAPAPAKPAPRPAPARPAPPAPAPTPPSPDANKLLGLGILLLGVAAILGVLYMIFKG